MKDLQTIINESAEKNLDKDINSLLGILQSKTYNDLLVDLFIQVPDACERKVRYQYFTGESKIKKYLKILALPRYIEKETRLFMQKVESLSKNVEELQGNIDNLLNNI